MRLKTMLAIGLVTALALVGLAAPASAHSGDGDRNGVCNEWELCLYYNPDETGSLSDIYWGNTPLSATCNNYAWGDCSHYNDYFISPGNGRGRRIINDVASAANIDGLRGVRIYAGKSCIGPYVQLEPSEHVKNLDDMGTQPNMRNNNESHCWVL